MTQHERMMERCFDLARLGAGAVSPNPMVGAVLVHDNAIIGEGWHKGWGKPHAEVNCFNSVAPENQHLIPQATLYCSLEPCSHFGKTPPCADLILAKKVPHVVVANTDPNPLVAGKGLERLRAGGVAVESGVLEQQGAWLNRYFFHWITQKRPYVILKWAQSADGFLGKTGEQTAISGKDTQRLVHRWRAACDAILVGAGTAVIDNPQLNARLFPVRNPLRILLDQHGIVPADRLLLADDQPTWIFGAERKVVGANKTFFTSGESTELSEVMTALYQQNRATLLVEGGAQVFNQFILSGIWDEIRLIENPIRLGSGIKAPAVPDGSLLQEQFNVADDVIRIFSRH